MRDERRPRAIGRPHEGGRLAELLLDERRSRSRVPIAAPTSADADAAVGDPFRRNPSKAAPSLAEGATPERHARDVDVGDARAFDAIRSVSAKRRVAT